MSFNRSRIKCFRMIKELPTAKGCGQFFQKFTDIKKNLFMLGVFDFK